MKKQSLYLLLPLFLFASCGKDDGPDNPWGLPDATKDGNNTFGCLINGELWVAEANGLGLQDIQSSYDEIGTGAADNFYFYITARYFPEGNFPPLDSALSDIFSMNFRPIYSEGELDFSQLNRKDATFSTSLLGVTGTSKTYELDTLNNNNVQITNLDTVKNIISAEFELRLLRINNIPDTLKITEGRFDVTYQPD
ncbi:MAG: hypothetical protein AB8F74_19520 [Saprospiraceae bacterium]